jgi:hypothetical protein
MHNLYHSFDFDLLLH